MMLFWLLLGTFTCNLCATNTALALVYDFVLGTLGIASTLTAAQAFPHKLVQNQIGQSGTLHHKAIVTQSEMIEHAYYQALNLVQALYLHLMHVVIRKDSLQLGGLRLILLWLVTSPWFVRRRLPIHSFSDNWKIYLTLQNAQRTELEIILYRIKKAQYLFYKHVVLHGLNIYMAVATISTADGLMSMPPYCLSWRVFWLLLNTSYVMEFFLQSLVKRRTIIRQSTMLWLQRWLMTCATIGASVVLWQLSVGQGGEDTWLLPTASIASLCLNFISRHHDVLNTMAVATIAMKLKR